MTARRGGTAATASRFDSSGEPEPLAPWVCDSFGVIEPTNPAVLKLRSEQVRALSLDEAYRGFVLAMIDHLRTHFTPELGGLDELALGEEVLVCLERARSYGITSRRDCARFLGLAAALGWSFDTERAWVPVLLRNAASGPSERLALVFERCMHELQQAADAIPLRQRFGL